MWLDIYGANVTRFILQVERMKKIQAKMPKKVLSNCPNYYNYGNRKHSLNSLLNEWVYGKCIHGVRNIMYNVWQSVLHTFRSETYQNRVLDEQAIK